MKFIRCVLLAFAALTAINGGVAFGQAAPVPYTKVQYFDSNGNPLSSGKLCTFSAGTTTPLTSYTDYLAGTANANPIVLDAAGRANVWLTNGTLYKLILYAAGGNSSCPNSGATLWSVDGVSAGAATISGTTNRVPKYTSATTLGNSSISDDGTEVLTAEKVSVGGTDGSGSRKLYVTGAFTPLSVAQSTMFGVELASMSVPVGQRGSMASIGTSSTLLEAASGTHPTLTGLYLVAPTVTAGAATATNTATLYINNAMTATVTGGNYALFVDAGESRLDGLLGVNSTGTEVSRMGTTTGTPVVTMYGSSGGIQTLMGQLSASSTEFDMCSAAGPCNSGYGVFSTYTTSFGSDALGLRVVSSAGTSGMGMYTSSTYRGGLTANATSISLCSGVGACASYVQVASDAIAVVGTSSSVFNVITGDATSVRQQWNYNTSSTAGNILGNSTGLVLTGASAIDLAGTSTNVLDVITSNVTNVTRFYGNGTLVGQIAGNATEFDICSAAGPCNKAIGLFADKIKIGPTVCILAPSTGTYRLLDLSGASWVDGGACP